MSFDYTHYNELTYLQSDGNSYIKTGFYPVYGVYDMKVLFPSLVDTSLYYYMGSANPQGTGYSNCPLAMSQSSKYLGFRYGSTIRWSSLVAVANTEYSIRVQAISGSETMEVNNSTVLSRTDSFNLVEYNFFIFGYFYQGVDTASHPMRLYHLRIYDTNNVLIHEFIPAQRKNDSVLGLYDTVADVFYTNAGTGNFVGGQIVPPPQDTGSIKTKINGEWLDSTPYIKVNGEWIEAEPYIKVNGEWLKAIK